MTANIIILKKRSVYTGDVRYYLIVAGVTGENVTGNIRITEGLAEETIRKYHMTNDTTIKTNNYYNFFYN